MLGHVRRYRQPPGASSLASTSEEAFSFSEAGVDELQQHDRRQQQQQPEGGLPASAPPQPRQGSLQPPFLPPAAADGAGLADGDVALTAAALRLTKLRLPPLGGDGVQAGPPPFQQHVDTPRMFFSDGAEGFLAKVGCREGGVVAWWRGTGGGAWEGGGGYMSEPHPCR